MRKVKFNPKFQIGQKIYQLLEDDTDFLIRENTVAGIVFQVYETSIEKKIETKYNYSFLCSYFNDRWEEERFFTTKKEAIIARDKLLKKQAKWIKAVDDGNYKSAKKTIKKYEKKYKKE